VMNKDFVFELDGGEEVVRKKKVVQSPWEFSGYSADVRNEYAERNTTSIDQKISQIRSSKNDYKGGPRGESEDEEDEEEDDDIGEVEDVDMDEDEEEVDEDEDEDDDEGDVDEEEEVDEEEDANGVDVSVRRSVDP
jgi:hypothetical protein